MAMVRKNNNVLSSNKRTGELRALGLFITEDANADNKVDCTG